MSTASDGRKEHPPTSQDSGGRRGEGISLEAVLLPADSGKRDPAVDALRLLALWAARAARDHRPDSDST
jgi:hypothetical protein